MQEVDRNQSNGTKARAPISRIDVKQGLGGPKERTRKSDINALSAVTAERSTEYLQPNKCIIFNNPTFQINKFYEQKVFKCNAVRGLHDCGHEHICVL